MLYFKEKQDFKRLNDTYDAILIDDVDFNQFNENQLLSIISQKDDATTRILYGTAHKKRDTVLIITLNYNQFKEVPYLFRQYKYSRRVLIYEPSVPFIMNVTINNSTDTQYGTLPNSKNTKKDTNIQGSTTFQKHRDREKRRVHKNTQTIERIASKTD